MFYKTTYDLIAKNEFIADKLMEDLTEYLINTLNEGNKFKTCSTEEATKHLCSCYKVNHMPDIYDGYYINVKHDKTPLMRLYVINIIEDGTLFILASKDKTTVNVVLKYVCSKDFIFKKSKTFNSIRHCVRDFLNIKTALMEAADRPFIIKSINVSTDYKHGLIDLVEL